LRVLYETREIPTDEELNKFQEIKKVLESQNIWHCIRMAGDSWYKLNHWEEIMIVDERGRVAPLSEYSRVVKYLGETRQTRIYVKKEDYDIAISKIKGIL